MSLLQRAYRALTPAVKAGKGTGRATPSKPADRRISPQWKGLRK